MIRRTCALGAAMLGLIAAGCSRGTPLPTAPSRPLLCQLTYGGELVLDSSMSEILRKTDKRGRSRNRDSRKATRTPIWGLYELLKGPDLIRHKTAAVVSLGAPLGKGADAGLSGLAETFNQADIEVVNLATARLAAASPDQVRSTRKALAPRGAALLGLGNSTGALEPVFQDLRDARVALLGVMQTADTTSNGIARSNPSDGDALVARVKQAAAGARQGADLVVLTLGWDTQRPLAERQALARKLVDEAGIDVLLGHHSGPFEGLEVRGERKLIVYNPGRMLTKAPGSGWNRRSLVLRLHLDKQGVRWVEAQPIRLLDGKSRIGMGTEETYGAIDKLIELSQQLGTKMLNEYGRGILDLVPPAPAAGT